MKKVMVFGTFDIFHEGHINLLKQARKYGEILFVVIARDANVLKLKGRLPYNNEMQRKEIVKNSGLADHVLLGSLNNKYKIIEKFGPDAIGLGYDQYQSIKELKVKLLEFNMGGVKIVRLKPFKPEIYKSSKFRPI